MSTGRKIIKPFSFTASTIVGNSPSGLGQIRVHGLTLTETAGTNKVVLDLYIPAKIGDGSHPIAPSSAGTHIGQIIVPAGSTPALPFPNLDDGILFEDGLYIAVSGTGTLLATAYIS